MSDIINISTGTVNTVASSCRVAYTINNEQPVLCTIIGQQPLFYMDYGADYEDEESLSLDAADHSILDIELDKLTKELDQFERFSESEIISSEEKMAAFLDNADFITNKDQEKSDFTIDQLKDILTQSRLVKAYLETMDKYDVELKHSDQVETALYDRKSAQILVNPNCSEVDQVLLTVQELRRHYQHRSGALINPLTFHPDNAILVNRAQVADLAVSVIRGAWELQLAGYKQAWERIENSSMADMGRAFARESFLDFRTINNGQGAAAIFEAWFLSERCRSEDKKIINQMLADHVGYVFDQFQSETSLTPSIIAELGEMPFGKNYLAEHAATIMDDAIFTEVRDRSNANFLWFIKFERTFRETEQELQIVDDQKGMGTSPSQVNSKSQGHNNGQQFSNTASNTAQIIQLPFGSNTKTSEEKQKTGRKLVSGNARAREHDKGDLSNIVYLRSRPSE